MATIDFWNQLYFKPMKIVSCLGGQWPYHTPLQRTIFRSILILAVGSQLITQLAALFEHPGDLDFVMELVPPFVIEVTCFTKMLNGYLFLDKIKILLEQLKENWKLYPNGKENELLHQHAKFGLILSLLFLGALYGAGVIFSLAPFQIILLQTLRHSNDSWPSPLLFDAKWGSIDVQHYYFTFIAISTFSNTCLVTMLVGIDCVFYMGCGHICGLFAALGYSIEQFNFDKQSQSADHGYAFLSKCIRIHNKVLEFSDIMEDVVTYNFLIMLGSVTMAMSLTAVQMVISLNSAEKLLKHLAFANTQITQLAIKCWMAQRVMDYSVNVKFNIINSKWYLAPPKTQKLIGLMIMRSEVPCEITAGKVIVMCMETFSSIVRLSASYFTMFLALR